MKYLILIVFFLSVSCKTKYYHTNKKCYKILKNDYSYTSLGERSINNDTVSVSLTSMRFQCVYSSFYTSKVMYDRFGRWDEVIHVNGDYGPVLVWEQVDLLQNGQELTILTAGEESLNFIFSEFLAYSGNYDDLLIDEVYRDRLHTYFSKAIRSNDESRSEFYDEYWKTVNPEQWKAIMKNREN